MLYVVKFLKIQICVADRKLTWYTHTLEDKFDTVSLKNILCLYHDPMILLSGFNLEKKIHIHQEKQVNQRKKWDESKFPYIGNR